MIYTLQISYEAKSINSKHLVVKRSTKYGNPETKLEFEGSDISTALTNLIPHEWEDEFQLLYDQERAIIAKRRELLTQYAIAFPSYIRQHHPEILV